MGFLAFVRAALLVIYNTLIPVGKHYILCYVVLLGLRISVLGCHVCVCSIGVCGEGDGIALILPLVI